MNELCVLKWWISQNLVLMHRQGRSLQRLKVEVNSRNLLKQVASCIVRVLVLYWSCVGPVLILIGPVLVLYWSCIGPVLVLYWPFIGPVLVLYWYCICPLSILYRSFICPVFFLYLSRIGPALAFIVSALVLFSQSKVLYNTKRMPVAKLLQQHGILHKVWEKC